ncbi:hypothetical protein BKI52_08150 [marine bacterium AO1-C]|nr:hypothetical protein BKI52_08150 [marine bacterium AO1-C]
MKKANVVKGVIYKGGKSIEGFIRQTGFRKGKSGFELQTPWDFQSAIYFIPKEKFEKNERIRGKHFTKYTPKKCDGYKYDDKYEYVSLKFVDLSKGVSLSLLPKRQFIRKMMDGKISLFQYFSRPTTLFSGESASEAYAKSMKPVLVFRKGNSPKGVIVEVLSGKKVFADCPDVLSSYKAKEYKAEDFTFATKYGKDLSDIEKRKLLAIFDYNKSCK